MLLALPLLVPRLLLLLLLVAARSFVFLLVLLWNALLETSPDHPLPASLPPWRASVPGQHDRKHCPAGFPGTAVRANPSAGDGGDSELLKVEVKVFSMFRSPGSHQQRKIDARARVSNGYYSGSQ